MSTGQRKVALTENGGHTELHVRCTTLTVELRGEQLARQEAERRAADLEAQLAALKANATAPPPRAPPPRSRLSSAAPKMPLELASVVEQFKRQMQGLQPSDMVLSRDSWQSFRSSGALSSGNQEPRDDTAISPDAPDPTADALTSNRADQQRRSVGRAASGGLSQSQQQQKEVRESLATLAALCAEKPDLLTDAGTGQLPTPSSSNTVAEPVRNSTQKHVRASANQRPGQRVRPPTDDVSAGAQLQQSLNRDQRVSMGGLDDSTAAAGAAYVPTLADMVASVQQAMRDVAAQPAVSLVSTYISPSTPYTDTPHPGSVGMDSRPAVYEDTAAQSAQSAAEEGSGSTAGSAASPAGQLQAAQHGAAVPDAAASAQSGGQGGGSNGVDWSDYSTSTSGYTHPPSDNILGASSVHQSLGFDGVPLHTPTTSHVRAGDAPYSGDAHSATASSSARRAARGGSSGGSSARASRSSHAGVAAAAAAAAAHAPSHDVEARSSVEDRLATHRVSQDSSQGVGGVSLPVPPLLGWLAVQGDSQSPAAVRFLRASAPVGPQHRPARSGLRTMSGVPEQPTQDEDQAATTSGTGSAAVPMAGHDRHSRGFVSAGGALSGKGISGVSNIQGQHHRVVTVSHSHSQPWQGTQPSAGPITQQLCSSPVAHTDSYGRSAPAATGAGVSDDGGRRLQRRDSHPLAATTSRIPSAPQSHVIGISGGGSGRTVQAQVSTQAGGSTPLAQQLQRASSIPKPSPSADPTSRVSAPGHISVGDVPREQRHISAARLRAPQVDRRSDLRTSRSQPVFVDELALYERDVQRGGLLQQVQHAAGTGHSALPTAAARAGEPDVSSCAASNSPWSRSACPAAEEGGGSYTPPQLTRAARASQSGADGAAASGTDCAASACRPVPVSRGVGYEPQSLAGGTPVTAAPGGSWPVDVSAAMSEGSDFSLTASMAGLHPGTAAQLQQQRSTQRGLVYDVHGSSGAQVARRTDPGAAPATPNSQASGTGGPVAAARAARSHAAGAAARRSVQSLPLVAAGAAGHAIEAAGSCAGSPAGAAAGSQQQLLVRPSPARYSSPAPIPRGLAASPLAPGTALSLPYNANSRDHSVALATPMTPANTAADGAVLAADGQAPPTAVAGPTVLRRRLHTLRGEMVQQRDESSTTDALLTEELNRRLQVEAGLREQVSSQAQQIQSLEVRLKAAMNANERLMDENANRSQRIVQLEALLARINYQLRSLNRQASQTATDTTTTTAAIVDSVRDSTAFTLGMLSHSARQSLTHAAALRPPRAARPAGAPAARRQSWAPSVSGGGAGSSTLRGAECVSEGMGSYGASIGGVGGGVDSSVRVSFEDASVRMVESLDLAVPSGRRGTRLNPVQRSEEAKVTHVLRMLKEEMEGRAAYTRQLEQALQAAQARIVDLRALQAPSPSLRASIRSSMAGPFNASTTNKALAALRKSMTPEPRQRPRDVGSVDTSVLVDQIRARDELVDALESRLNESDLELQEVYTRCEALDRTVTDLEMHMDMERTVAQSEYSHLQSEYRALEARFQHCQSRMSELEVQLTWRTATTQHIRDPMGFATHDTHHTRGSYPEPLPSARGQHTPTARSPLAGSSTPGFRPAMASVGYLSPGLQRPPISAVQNALHGSQTPRNTLLGGGEDGAVAGVEDEDSMGLYFGPPRQASAAGTPVAGDAPALPRRREVSRSPRQSRPRRRRHTLLERPRPTVTPLPANRRGTWAQLFLRASAQPRGSGVRVRGSGAAATGGGLGSQRQSTTSRLFHDAGPLEDEDGSVSFAGSSSMAHTQGDTRGEVTQDVSHTTISVGPLSLCASEVSS